MIILFEVNWCKKILSLPPLIYLWCYGRHGQDILLNTINLPCIRLGVVFVMFNYRMEVSSTSLLPWLKDHIDEMLSQSLPTGIGLSVCTSVFLCVYHIEQKFGERRVWWILPNHLLYLPNIFYNSTTIISILMFSSTFILPNWYFYTFAKLLSYSVWQ